MRILFIWISITVISSYCYSQQGISNIWLQGYGSAWGSPPWGITHTDFYGGNPVMQYMALPMEFRHTHANISDAQGNLLFYTNGVYIADATHNVMMNGYGINPGAYSNSFPDGHLIPQGALIIPKPGSNSIYYLFHNTLDNYPGIGSYSYYLYMTAIDMSLNNGLGAVTLKNYPIISDTLNCGKITACKHANGRDWWVVCHRVNSNKYYKLLVTPFSLPTVSFQNIGSFREWDAGQAKFSPDGEKFAYFHYRFTGLDIFNFDRCSGTFSNWVNDSLPLVVGNVGCEFSPNSQFLYVCNILKVYQYDVTAANILATRTEVAVWDSFHQPGIPALGAYLCYPQLAPDGKIYITTGNGTTYMGRINNPDVAGIACDVAQHSVVLPTYYFNTLPNHPNYFLGCDTTCTPCLVGLTPGPSPKERGVTANPNPNNGAFTLQFDVQSTAGELLIYDVNGRMVYKDYIAPWSQFKRVEMKNELASKAGIYLCMLKWGERSVAVKVIIQDVN
jgi:hypothetical protein